MSIEKTALSDGFFIILAMAYFPEVKNPSIIGAGGLNFCVRDGNRCGPSARITKAIQ